MTEQSLDELFHGKELAEKAKQFNAELKVIDEKHKGFFENRVSHLPSQNHDSVFNHTFIITENGRVTFNFKDNELPQHIKDDCIEAFKRVYPGATQKK